MTVPSVLGQRSFTRPATQLTVVLVMTLLAGCGLTAPVAAGDTPPTSASSDPSLDAEQEKLSSDIEHLSRERDELRHRTPAPSAQPSRTPPPQGSAGVAGLSQSFAALSRRLGGSIGLAYAPIGRANPATSYGELRGGVGWSTMKVPVAIATVKKAGANPSADTLRLMRLAITASDNDSAMALWSRLGSPSSAAAQTQAVLREGGDTTTQVPSQRLRPGFTPFGQADWSLAAESTFAASLPCMANTDVVLALMGQVTPSQRWGIGALDTTVAFKGGWGPGRDGGYLVRQMAIVQLDDGSRIGVALGARPRDGRFETGISDLNAVARWVSANIHAGGADHC